MARGDRAGLREELGDLLMGVLMAARVAAEEDDGVDPGSVARAVTAKLIRRHPHVYGEVTVADSGEVLRNWEDIKRAERRAGGKEDSVLGGVPVSLPALTLAKRVGDKAAAAGFDWPDLAGPALRRTVTRFRDRFRHVERRLGKDLRRASLDELEALWREAKRGEGDRPPDAHRSGGGSRG